MDYGSSHHMPFGRALVFTFGPLVSLYTDFRVPEHDAAYLLLATVLTLGAFAGFLLASTRRTRAWLLVLPPVLANLLIKDALLFVLPLMLVLAACERRLPPLPWSGAYGLVAVAVGLLPLIKGTAIVPVVVCTGLSCVVFARDRSPWAIVTPLLIAFTAAAVWVGMGQSLSDVPAYLLNLSQVAGGYTDAMSTFGSLRGPIIFGVLALGLTALFAMRRQRHHAIVLLAILCTLFVAFKAAFVRYDGHAVTGASCLVLISLLLLLHEATRRACAALVVCLAGWLAIARPHVPVDAATLLSNVTGRLGDSATAIALRITAPEQLFAPFGQAKAAIRSEAALPAMTGTVDLYPYDMAPLLAAGLPWAPRPVLQSYSAYTPDLAALNARHLEGQDAPANVLFAVATIDGRYPSLDDAASWPALLSHYEFRSFHGPYALLQRSAVDHRAAIGAPVLQLSVPFGTDVAVPPGLGRAWASFRFRPTPIGRLATVAFKRTPLFLHVTLASGVRKSFRLIASMADGFLLSPFVGSAEDFATLSTGDADLLADNEIRSFRIEEASTYGLWGKSVDVTLSPLTFEPHRTGDRELYGTLAPGAPFAAIRPSGECFVDSVGSISPDAEITPRAPRVKVEGWGLVGSGEEARSPPLRIALVDRDGRTFYSEAQRIVRPDVNTHFGLPANVASGYTSVIDLRTLHGAYAMHVVQEGPDGPVTCATRPITIRR